MYLASLLLIFFASAKLSFSESYFQEEQALPGHFQETEESKVKAKATPYGEGGWEIKFLFPETVTYTKTEEAGTLYLTLNQAVDALHLDKEEEKIGYLIRRFSNGYNSFYLVPKRAVFYQVEAEDKTLILRIVPNYQIKPVPTRLLKLAQARLLVEKRCYKKACAALNCLLKEYPCDKEAQVLLSGLEGLFPRWQRQVGILKGLHQAYPCDRDITFLLKEAAYPHAPRVKVERQVQWTITQATCQLYKLSAEELVGKALYLGEWLLAERGHITSVVNSQGNSEGFLGTRGQGRFYLRKELDNGSRYTGTLYAASGGVVGVGGKAVWLVPALQGDFGLMADWHRPYWATFESLAFFGREDIIKGRINSVFSRWLSWSVAAGFQNVGIRNVPNGFKAVQTSVEVFWNWKITNPGIALNYSLDAEYVFDRAVKIGENGAPFNPVPLTSWENHTLSIYYTYQWKTYWYLTIFAGETFNRLGNDNPTAGIALKYVCPCFIEMELSAYRFPSTIVQGAVSKYFTGTLIWRF